MLEYSGGAGATIRMGYAEALYTPAAAKARPDKGNRNEVDGKEFVGNYDLVVADGGRNRRYSPLWWRTYRYLELTIETQGEPLVIDDLHGIYTGYPFERRSQIETGSAVVPQILDVGWRTARLCAHESYMDCPYYEQLQYAGDTRIQALVSLYTAGDARLVKNAIAHLNDSRTAEGATMSRAPTRQQQYIPPFSLWWIGMVHDYYMYVDDPAFVREMLPGVRAVLQFFAAATRRPTGRSGRCRGGTTWTGPPSGAAACRRATPTGRAPRSTCSCCSPTTGPRGLEADLGSTAMAAEYAAAAATLRADDPAALLGRGPAALRRHAGAQAVLPARQRARRAGGRRRRATRRATS